MSQMENNKVRPLIIEFGTDTFRMGFAGDDFPDIIAPTIYVNISDYLFSSDIIDGLEEIYTNPIKSSELVGHEALKYQNILKLHEFKKENNYNILMKFFMHYYSKLNIPPEFQFQQPLIILSPFHISEIEKSKLQEIFLNVLNFPSMMYLSEAQAILSTLQKTSGVILNMGETYTYISSIFHGFTNIMARDLFPIAGKDLTAYLLNLIVSKIGSSKSIYIDTMIAKEIKEKLSLCVSNPKEEKRRVKEGLTKYDRIIDLPDGSQLKLNLERFLLSEPLFNPKIIHIDYIGIAEAISKVIKTWERENWEELLSNIILAGGTSLIIGFNERLELELQKFFSEKLKGKIKVIAASGRENMGWIGASILYSKDQLKKGWIENSDRENSKFPLEDQV
jgi:centractin